jgi:hypothetical protein
MTIRERGAAMPSDLPEYDEAFAEQAAAVLDSPAKFCRWWQQRDARYDRRIVAEAVRRGLIVRGNGFIWLTMSGKNFCAAAGRGDG